MSMPAPLNVIYNPEPTPARFHRSNAGVRVLVGPVGSGKTVACCNEIKMLATQQMPDNTGTRRSKCAFVRNTYPELESTTLRTWLEWVGGEALGKVNYKYPMTQVLRWALADGTTVELECLFLALDRDVDEGKLKSLELSWIYFNELSEIAFRNWKMGIRRVDRFPKMANGGVGCTFPAVIADTNPFDTDHWAYRLFEESKPVGFELFKQPGAAVKDAAGPYMSLEGTRYSINPKAENLKNLSNTYIQQNIVGHDDASIKVYMLGEYGVITDGKPVYAGYRDDFHFSHEPLPVYRGLPLLLFFDFGLTPTVIFAQYSPRGQLRLLDEAQADGGIITLIREKIRPALVNEYHGMPVNGWGDPAGAERVATDERTCYDDLKAANLNILPAHTNDLLPRTKAVEDLLGRAIDGEAALIIGPRCRKLRAGFLGKYRRARMRVSGTGENFKDVPVKDEYSHYQDALQYGCMGITGKPLQNSGVVAAVNAYNRNLGLGGDRVVGY